MAYETKSVVFSESEVSTLEDLAKDLAPRYGWKSWHVDGSNIVFEAEDERGQVKKGYVGPSGFAYCLEEKEEDRFGENDSWDDYNVNWDEDFDAWNNHVWGEDENGDTVMVHD